MNVSRQTAAALTAAALLFSDGLHAAGESGSLTDLTCSRAGYNTLMNFNYDSAFPLRIMGSDTVMGSDVPAPPTATRKKICKCGKEPYVIYGYTRGMWLPTRFVEVVREASCSPVYGESVKPLLQQIARVSGIGQLHPTTLMTAGEAAKPHETSFRHVHSWSFPFNPYNWNPRCFHKGDNLETSISQISWSKKDPVLMNLLYPEWAALGTIANQPLFDLAAHSASCVANTTGIGWGPVDDTAYWLGGCMGNNLPAAGSMSAAKNSIIGTSTILNRSLMMSNRTSGYASVSTVGDKALCSPVPVPYPSKSEFKASMLFPYPESGQSTGGQGGMNGQSGPAGMLSGEVADFANIGSRGAHRLGASNFAWAMGRSDQALNENDSDAVYLLWRWVDCCEFN